MASTGAGRNEALGLHELEFRRLQTGTLSGFVEYLCLASAAGAECRVALGSRVTTHSNDLNANNSKNNLGRTATTCKKNGPAEVKVPQIGVSPATGLIQECTGTWSIACVQDHSGKQINCMTICVFTRFIPSCVLQVSYHNVIIVYQSRPLLGMDFRYLILQI